MLELTGFRCRRIETGLKDSENLSAEFKIGLNRSCSQWQQRSRGQFHDHKLGGKIPPGKICPKFGGKEKFHQVKNSYFMGKK